MDAKYKIFYESKLLLELIEALNKGNEDFEVSKYNVLTFDSESIGDIYAYEVFLKKFEEMSGKMLKFSDIEVAEAEYDLQSSVVEDFILQDLGIINGKIKLKKFNFGAMNKPIFINFKINGSSRKIEAESLCGFFDYKFLEGLNEILRELGSDKLFFSSDCWEECSIIYATEKDVELINSQMKDNLDFRGNNPFKSGV